MPTHPPRADPTKKRDILVRREVALRRAISENQDERVLLRAANDVREAQLNLLKSRLALLRFRKGLDPSTHPGAQIDRDIEAWQDMAPGEIVSSYRTKQAEGQ